jgi:hypothetical protein
MPNTYEEKVKPFIAEQVRSLREAGFNVREPGYRQAFLMASFDRPQDAFLRVMIFLSLHRPSMPFKVTTTTTPVGKGGFLTEVLISYDGLFAEGVEEKKADDHA